MNAIRKHPSPVEVSRAVCEGASGDLEHHLATCLRCAATWASFMEVEALAHELPARTPQANEDRVEENLAEILAMAGSHAPAPPRGAWWRLAIPVFALASAAAVVIVVLARRSDPSRQSGVSLVDTAVTYRGAVRAQPGARFIRESAAPDEVVRLYEGTIAVELTELRPGERFRVVVADAEIEGNATGFEVAAKADALVGVQVVRGLVDVHPARRARAVIVAGQRWDADPVIERATLLEAPPVVDEQEAHPPPVQRAKREVESLRQAPAAPTTPSVDLTMARLFDRGWKQLRAGSTSAAIKTFDEALAKYPQDPLAEDSAFWRCVALARVQRVGEARQALERFLDMYPRSPRAGEASAMLGWILVRAGDADAAEARFRAAERDPVESVRVSADKGLAAIAAARTR